MRPIMTRWSAALVVALVAGTAAAQSSGDDQKRRLVEQKIRLVEMLINSPAAKNAAGRDDEAATLVRDGRQGIEAAKKSLDDGRLDEASKLLDEALKSVSAASRKLSAEGGGLSDSALKKTLQDLTDQVASYRASVADLGRDAKVGAAAKALLGRIDALSSEAQQLARGGRLGDANKKMAEAYKLAVEEISRLRAGQEVVMSLKFETPADEYAYEQKRYASNEILVEMMIGEGRAEGDKRKLVDQFVEEGRKLKVQAEAQAGAGKHKDAVGLMEKATGQLNRALQSMGVPVF